MLRLGSVRTAEDESPRQSEREDTGADTSFDTSFNFGFDFGPSEEISTIAPENAADSDAVAWDRCG